MIHVIQAILLGIVEGLTEFLPISSTGHLIVAEKALGFNDVREVFTVVVQLGAISAVIWFFWRDLLKKIVGIFRWEKQAQKFWLLLIIGTIPAGLAGLALDSFITKIDKPVVVAFSLIIGGFIIWAVDHKPVTSKEPVQHIDISHITLSQAVKVGIGQILAIVPGVSRSGATIVTGLVSGLNRPTATAFSFYLGIPILVLASGLQLVKYHQDLSLIPGGTLSLIAGLISAFITAFIAVGWLLRYIAHHNFKPFAYYRIAVGVLILILVAVGWL